MYKIQFLTNLFSNHFFGQIGYYSAGKTMAELGHTGKRLDVFVSLPTYFVFWCKDFMLMSPHIVDRKLTVSGVNGIHGQIGYRLI